MKLYICEKPSQGRDYAKALGIKGGSKEGYIESGDTRITWCIGHLLTPYDPNDYDENLKKWSLKQLPILPRDKWEYKPNPATKKQLKVVKKLIEEADEVVIASDADREGELIVVSLLEKYNFKGKRTRVFTGALDPNSINKAISRASDGKDSFNSYLEALTRQKADWVHGMNMTRGMTVANNGKIEGIFSVGRVQTPVLNLFVMRDLEIENFKSKDYFNIDCTFKVDDALLKTSWKTPEEFLDPEEKKCLDKKIVDDVIAKIKGKNGVVTKSEKVRKKELAPLMYSLSELQMECNTKFGFTSDETLDIAQSLYETHKATTYPRTDSKFVNLEFFGLAKKTMECMRESDPGNEEFNSFYERADLKKKTKVWDDSKVEAHHAIIPNMVVFDINALNDKELKVYDLIKRRYLSQFFPDAESDSTSIEIECEKEIFRASASVSIVQGWKEVIGTKSKDKELPPIDKGQDVFDAKPKLDAKKTKPPARYTEATILKAMLDAGKLVDGKEEKEALNDAKGIGTEATRGNILKTLRDRGFVKLNKKDYISTEKGRSLIALVPEEAKSIEMTAFWETELKKIGQGKKEYTVFLNEQEKLLNKMLDKIRSGECTLKSAVGSLYNCPNCESALRKTKKSEKTGKIYWRCMNSESCGTIFNDNRGKPLFPKKVDQGEKEYFCDCSKKLTRKYSDAKNLYYWKCPDRECSIFYTDNDMTPVKFEKKIIEQPKNLIECPHCKKDNLERKEGQYGFYYNCKSCSTNYPEKNGEMAPDIPETTEYECPHCKKANLIKKNGQYGEYFSCIKCKKNTKMDKSGKPILPETSEYKCKECKTGHMIKKNGSKGEFYACNNYPKCKTSVPIVDGKPEGY